MTAKWNLQVHRQSTLEYYVLRTDYKGRSITCLPYICIPKETGWPLKKGDARLVGTSLIQRNFKKEPGQADVMVLELDRDLEDIGSNYPLAMKFPG